MRALRFDGTDRNLRLRRLVCLLLDHRFEFWAGTTEVASCRRCGATGVPA